MSNDRDGYGERQGRSYPPEDALANSNGLLNVEAGVEVDRRPTGSRSRSRSCNPTRARINNRPGAYPSLSLLKLIIRTCWKPGWRASAQSRRRWADFRGRPTWWKARRRSGCRRRQRRANKGKRKRKRMNDKRRLSRSRTKRARGARRSQRPGLPLPVRGSGSHHGDGDGDGRLRAQGRCAFEARVV